MIFWKKGVKWLEIKVFLSKTDEISSKNVDRGKTGNFEPIKRKQEQNEMKEMEEIIAIVDKYHWTFAKSLSSTPHWYIVRDKVDDEDYVKLYKFIKTHYIEEKFYSKTFRYCYIGKYKYWIMTDDINQSRIINRCERGVRYGHN